MGAVYLTVQITRSKYPIPVGKYTENHTSFFYGRYLLTCRLDQVRMLSTGLLVNVHFHQPGWGVQRDDGKGNCDGGGRKEGG
jgi:hypothetical protein